MLYKYSRLSKGLCLFFFLGNFAACIAGETCAQKLDRVIKEISDSREIRFHGLHPITVRYRSYILDHKPDVKRKIKFNSMNSEERLGRFYRGAKPSEVRYMLETHMLEADFKGGEASIFKNPANPTQAFKVWNKSRMEDFEMSTRAMLLFEERIEKSNALKNHMTVSKITEMGKNYIVKEFAPKSTPLQKMVGDPKVKKILKSLKRELSKTTDPMGQKLMVAIGKKPISDNLHWDPDKGKILLIDALGF